MQLAIHCRGGRAETVVTGSGSGESAISYRINDNQPVQLGAIPSSFGTSTAFTGDVVRLLQSLPEEGSIVVRLSVRTGSVQVGHSSLDSLKLVREKIAAAYQWPHTVDKPRN